MYQKPNDATIRPEVFKINFQEAHSQNLGVPLLVKPPTFMED